MRITTLLVLLFVFLGAAPAEAQLFRKIFKKSGGGNQIKEQQDAPAAAPEPPPVVEEPVPASKPVTVAPDTLSPIKPTHRTAASEAGRRETSSGYRVQIYNGPNRAAAMRLKEEMEIAYPNMRVYLVYRQPNFRVRMGDFRSQRDAEQLLPEFRQLGYKTSFVVPDEVLIE